MSERAVTAGVSPTDRISTEIEKLRAVVAREPGHSVLQARLGSLLHVKGDNEGAKRHLRLAVAIDPTLSAAQLDLGKILLREADMVGAFAAFGAYQTFHPQDWMRIRIASAVPALVNSRRDIAILEARVRQSLKVLSEQELAFGEVPPRDGVPLFHLAYYDILDRPFYEALAALYRRAWPELAFTAPHCTGPRKPHPDGKIHVGFVSSFFYKHSIGNLFHGLIAALDRKHFHVTLATLPNVDDEATERMRKSADRSLRLTDRYEEARAALAAEALDVLVYPELGMDNLTYFLAHARLARVQCMSWGHPASSGLPSMDYFVSSKLLEAEDADAHYSEKLVRLSTLPSYLIPPAAGTVKKGRVDFGLDPARRYYLVGQYLFKLHPDFDALLGAILAADPEGTVLVVRGKHAAWERFLMQRLRRTIPEQAGRIQFVDAMEQQEFFALIGCVDVCLDVPSFNGGNTTIEALTIGTPVVTLRSRYMRGRVGAAIYQAMDTMDCVAVSGAQYVDLAVRAARDPAFRDQVRAKIAANRSKLFRNSETIAEWERFFREASAA